MNYARNLIQEISNPNTTEEEMAFGFDDFYEAMNIILGNCQLGKLYYANPFDWLILESIEKLATYYDDDDIERNSRRAKKKDQRKRDPVRKSLPVKKRRDLNGRRIKRIRRMKG